MEEKKMTQQNGMTRRTFMKGAAAGVAALSLASVLPANEAQAAIKKTSKIKKNGIYVEGGNTNLNGQTYTLEFIQPVQLVAYIDGKAQTEGTWRSENKHLVSVDLDGTIVLRDGVGGYEVPVTWTLGSTTYTVTFITCQTIGAHSIDTDSPITRGQFMVMLAKYFGWAHYNAVMDDGTDIADDGTILTEERVRNYYDVTGEAEWVKPIESALDMGVLTAASPDECFYPLSYMTREDAAVILAKAFLVDEAPVDCIKGFKDVKKTSKGAYAALNAMVYNRFMQGTTETTLEPTGGMSISDTRIAIQNMTKKRVAPVWSFPVSHRKFVRCRPLWQCPTEGATVKWRCRAFNISHPDEMGGLQILDRGKGITLVEEWGDWYDYVPGHGTVPMFGLNNCSDLPYDRVWFCVEVEAYAVKEGMQDSPVSTFIWRIDRPAWHDFAHDVLHEGDKNYPTIHRYFDNFQAAAYYIEGTKYGILYDGLMPTNTTTTLIDRVKEVATKPFIFVLGHNHGDHKGAMAEAYANYGMDIYCASRATIKDTSYSINYYNTAYTSGNKVIDSTLEGIYEGDRVHEVEEGDIFDIGNAQFHVYRLPGHEDGMIILHEPNLGLMFSSDIYGVNRYWVADQFSASGVKQDLVMSLHQQLMVKYRENGGQISELYTGHNRAGVGAEYLRVWENALQNLSDDGYDALSDDYRGDGALVTRDGSDLDTLNWQAIAQSGSAVMAEYTGQYDGKTFTRYEINKEKTTLNLFYPDSNSNSALSNIVIPDGNLIGHDFHYKAGFATELDELADGSLKYIIPNKFCPQDEDTTYTVEVKKNKVTIVPVTMTNYATVAVNGEAAASHCPVTVSTAAPAEITVTAPDGSTTTYVLEFVKVRQYTKPANTTYTKKNAFTN